MDKKIAEEIREWLYDRGFLWNRKADCITAFRRYIYDEKGNYLPDGKEVYDFICFEDKVKARFTDSDDLDSIEDSCAESIAVVEDMDGFYVHYLYDEDKRKGAAMTGPYGNILDAYLDVRKRRPEAKMLAPGKGESVGGRIRTLAAAVDACLSGGSMENYSAPEQAYIFKEAEKILWAEFKAAEPMMPRPEEPSGFEGRKTAPPVAHSPRLFVDMDGTLARFHDEVKYLERMYEPDFFRNLKPFENAVETVRLLMRTHPEWEVYILSAILPGDPPGCEKQKQDWIDQYLPGIDRAHRLFPEMGIDKSTIIPGGIGETDVLLDDYNKNLDEWRQAGGTAVKFVNNINDRALHGKRFDGMRMHFDCGAKFNVGEFLRQLPFETATLGHEFTPYVRRGPKL